MNRKEWEDACKKNTVDRYFDHKCRNIQRSLQYNKNPEATVRHHLMSTPEQIAYNTKHYEMWGFEINENGEEIFEYGKYVIFCTKEEHCNIWHNVRGENNPMYGKEVTEDIRKKLSLASLKKWKDDVYRNHMVEKQKLKWKKESYRLNFSSKMSAKYENEEYRKRHIEARLGENNPMYGKEVSEETRCKISIANKGRVFTEEAKKHLRESAKNKPPVSDKTRENLSKAVKESWKNADDRRKRFSERISGKNNPMYGKKGSKHPQYGKKVSEEIKIKLRNANIGKHLSDETKNKIKETLKVKFAYISSIYKQYKDLGGILSWKEFKHKDTFDRISNAIKTGNTKDLL